MQIQDERQERGELLEILQCSPGDIYHLPLRPTVLFICYVQKPGLDVLGERHGAPFEGGLGMLALTGDRALSVQELKFNRYVHVPCRLILDNLPGDKK